MDFLNIQGRRFCFIEVPLVFSNSTILRPSFMDLDTGHFQVHLTITEGNVIEMTLDEQLVFMLELLWHQFSTNLQ